MPTVLAVEDSRLFMQLIQHTVKETLGFDVVGVGTLAQAKKVLHERTEPFFLALLDLNLPDVRDGEIVDLMLAEHLPSIVFSAEFDPELRERMLAKNIVDYVSKDSPTSMDNVLSLIARIHSNQSVKVLVVEDSQSMRKQMKSILSLHCFQILEASDGLQALDILEKNPAIKMVITDNDMPNMSGLELTRELRKNWTKKQLAIIGISASDKMMLSARFIKAGANDFVHKPFQIEEFICRVNLNIEWLEQIQALENSIITDFLTGLRNRRYLFERGETMMKEAQELDKKLFACMMDIDFFKRVNDSHGHDGGDAVLKFVAATMAHALAGKALLARLGGEEFCALMVSDDGVEVSDMFDRLRQDLENGVVVHAGQEIRVTCSFGLSARKCDNLDDLIKVADECLYTAKQSGRNRVIVDTKKI